MHSETMFNRNAQTGMAVRIGVMGSASGAFNAAVRDRCRSLGEAIARAGCCLLTGACPGLPHETVLGAKAAGGHVVGISPAVDFVEHVSMHHSPYAEYDVMIFTGLGFMGRELINIRSCDIIVIVGGSSGTLGELAIAFEEGKVIGVLMNTGGISELIPALEAAMTGKHTGAQILYEDDPKTLVDRLLAHVRTTHGCSPS